MRKQFDIKFRPQIESGKYKVETRDRRPARIICWDRKLKDFPILALVYFDDEDYEEVYSYFIDGHFYSDEEHALDLFILTDESELTEFEKHVQAVMENSGLIGCRDKYKDINCVKVTSASLLKIAFKELEKICKTQNTPNWYKNEENS